MIYIFQLTPYYDKSFRNWKLSELGPVGYPNLNPNIHYIITEI